jgi:hypothetical protein
MELLDWTLSNTLLLTPKFQRRGVWQPAARSFFIDTLLRGMPVPPVYMRLTQSPKKDKVIREVIDGQQRISAVTSYMRDQYALSGNLVSSWKGKKFSELTKAEQDEIKNYPFNAESFQGISDAEVLEIFSRLNTYSVPLNAQELRNGKFFGHFKQVAYSLAYEHLEFWRNNKVFTERSIARMDEVELVSELLAASVAGPQHGKKTLDNFYLTYDEDFPEKDKVVKRFRTVISEISDLADTNLGETQFHRPPLLYTLYCVVYHRRYGLSNVTARRPAKVDAPLSKADKVRLAQAVVYLSELIENVKNEIPIEDAFLPFIAAASRHTDDSGPRQVRFETLYARAFA